MAQRECLNCRELKEIVRYGLCADCLTNTVPRKQYRSIGVCIECYEEKEIVSRGLCGRCLASKRREERKLGTPEFAAAQARALARSNKLAQRHQAGIVTIRKIVENDPLYRPEDVQTFKDILRKYWATSGQDMIAENRVIVDINSDNRELPSTPVVDNNSQNQELSSTIPAETVELSDEELMDLTAVEPEPEENQPTVLTVADIVNLENERVTEAEEVNAPEPPKIETLREPTKRPIVLEGEEYKQRAALKKSRRIAKKKARRKKGRR